MSKKGKRRAARRKLRAHDRGLNRHNKGLSWILKAERLKAERNAIRRGRAAA